MSDCVLCKFAGSSENVVIAEIMKYVSESVGKVCINEIASQVSMSLNEELRTNITEAQVIEHIQKHTLEQKVVLSNILQDLISLADTVKEGITVSDGDTGCTIVDTKTLTAYLKTVDQITAIYKMESMRNIQR